MKEPAGFQPVVIAIRAAKSFYYTQIKNRSTLEHIGCDLSLSVWADFHLFAFSPKIVIDWCRVVRVVYRILANVEQTSDLAVGTTATIVMR